MELKTFNYDNAMQSDSAVVLYAGPSVSKNCDRINKYIKENNSIVIGSNYNYENIGLISRYTYMANDFKLIENITKINNDVIVPGRIFSGEIDPKITRKFIRRHISSGFSVYMTGKPKDKTTYSIKSGSIEVERDGCLPYGRLSSAGHGCMFLSLVLRPKKVLFIGLDGPTDATCEKKIMFDGKVQNYGKPQKNENFKRHFVDVVLPSLFSRNIVIETFDDVAMYGLDKKSLNIGVI